MNWSAQRSGGRPLGRRRDEGGVEAIMSMAWVPGCHELSLPLNRVCTGQSSDSERARDQWQCAAVTPQVKLSFSFVSRGGCAVRIRTEAFVT